MKQRYIQLSIRVPIEMHEDLKRASERTNLSINHIMLHRIRLGTKVDELVEGALPRIFEEAAKGSAHEIVNFVFSSGPVGMVHDYLDQKKKQQDH